MSGARTVKVHARRGQVADFHRFLTPGMLNRPKCSTMACRHGQSTDLARHRTAERSRRAGPGLRFERCPGRRSLLLRRRSVLGLLCAARGRLGVGPISPLSPAPRSSGAGHLRFVEDKGNLLRCAGSSAPLMRAVAAPSRPAGAPLIHWSGVDVDVPDLPGQYKSQIQPGPASKATSCAAAWACRGPQCGNSVELVSGLQAPSNPTF